jgi:TraB/PrgY/gumN family
MVAARFACVLSLSLLGAAALAQTDPPSASTPAGQELDAAPATVVVSGKRPGPGLWKVSKDGHVMWVFALYSPLPQKMEWESARVERLVAQSQEMLLQPGVSVTVGWMGGLTMLPSLIGLRKNPDGARLHDLLPADVYARWDVLKQKYIGDDDDIERFRPYFAAEGLMDAGLKRNGLSKGYDVTKAIVKIAKDHDVKLTNTAVSVTLENPRAALKDFKASQMEDVACFTRTLGTLEGDLDAMKLRANAWANGNIAEIGKLDYAEREDACDDAMMNGSFARNNPAFQNMRERGRAAWMKTAEQALAKNASTFALLSMGQVLGPRSYLAELQAKGYTVESPR